MKVTRKTRMKQYKRRFPLLLVGAAALACIPESVWSPLLHGDASVSTAPSQTEAVPSNPKIPEVRTYGEPNPFAPYPVLHMAAKPATIHWISIAISCLLFGSASICLGMIGLRRRWQLVQKNGHMAAKLASAIKRGALQVNGFGMRRNQRSSARVAYQGAARVCWKGKYFKRAVRGNCVDLSATGVGMLCAGAVPEGMEVEVQLEAGGVPRRAIVKHCQAHTSKFFVGLHFLDTAGAVRSSAA